MINPNFDYMAISNNKAALPSVQQSKSTRGCS